MRSYRAKLIQFTIAVAMLSAWLVAGCSAGSMHPETVWYFSQDVTTNAWKVTIVDPSTTTGVIKTFAVDDLGDLSGDAGNGAGPSWGDVAVGTGKTRVFANAMNVGRVAVFNTDTQSLETVLEVGGRPVHLFNPNHGTELWSHADAEGAFYVIDQETLEVSDPIVAAQNDTGHGKLLYAHELGTDYYATNTNDAGAFPIDGAARTVGEMLSLCAQPCADDPSTPEDESLLTCGGTHDKGYNPKMGWAYFQCSGATSGHFAFVDTATNTVVHDLVPMSGSVAHSPGYEYTLLLNGDDVQIWDTAAPGHNGLDFDATVTLSGSPSSRGTEFRQNAAGQWEAWLPQNAGTQVSIVNLATLQVDTVEIGVVTAPPGGGHFNRRGIFGGSHFFTWSDAGIVMIDADTHEVTQFAASVGEISRLEYVNLDAPQH